MKIEIGADRNRVPRPEWVVTLREQGGLVNGMPAYRLVWGYVDHDRYRQPERWLERWHLEWLHPMTRQYERLVTFEEGITKEFMPPTVALLIETLEAHQRTTERTRKQIREKIEREIAQREEASAAKKEAHMEDSLAAFPLKTWMPVSGPMTAESRRRSEYGG